MEVLILLVDITLRLSILYRLNISSSKGEIGYVLCHCDTVCLKLCSMSLQ